MKRWRQWVVLGFLGAWLAAAHAQTPGFAVVWADREMAANVLGKEDDYVRQTAPLERMAKTRRAEPVAIPQFLEHMRKTSKDWGQRDRERLTPLLTSLGNYVGELGVRVPKEIILVRTSNDLEDGLPHTRGTAIVLPDSAFDGNDVKLTHVLVHEYFHVLTRHNPVFKEKAYALLGFEKCDAVQISPQVQAMRVTNPDTPVSEHVLKISRSGKSAYLLPYLVFDAPSPDTRKGFSNFIAFPWLLVSKAAGQCVFADTEIQDRNSMNPQRTPEVLAQVGKNTMYLFHPEEILADNFHGLYLVKTGVMRQADAPSPEVLERLRALLTTKE